MGWRGSGIRSVAATLVMAALESVAAGQVAMRAFPEGMSAFAVAPVVRVEPRVEPRVERRGLWVASIAALVAANIADSMSSWRKDESNGVLAGGGGQFGMRGVAIKGGVNALWIVGQALALRKNRAYRTMSIANFAGAAVFGGLAYRNSAIGRGGGLR
jgi:hypothetical protein